MKKYLYTGLAVATLFALGHTQEVSAHTVQSGDTLWGISQQYGTTVDQLVANNQLSNPDVLYIGQYINTGTASNEVNTLQAPVAESDWVSEIADSTTELTNTTPSAINSDPRAAFDYITSEYGVSSWDKEMWAYIINRESGWNHTIWNYSGSGAYGLPQALPASKMASAGSDYMTNPYTQLKWMHSYMVSRYGSIQGAYNHSINKGWY